MFCGECFASAGDEEDFCGKCGVAKPAEGWGPDGLIGTVIVDKYELIERLGSGGMGYVYRARHSELGTDFAIKFLHRDVSTPVHRRRFQREARTAAALKGPHCVQVLDFGTLDDDRLYLVMEYVAGLNLAEYVDEHGQPSSGFVLEVLEQIATALEEAHEHGTMHRDVKPENIMVVQTKRGILCKLTDFGIAGVVADGGERLTQTGMVHGSPGYMSPEQASGARELDGRTDLYALGVIAWELLADRAMFEASTPLELIVKHARDEPDSLREVRSAQGAGELPDALYKLVADLLVKDRDGRTASAEALLVQVHAAKAALVNQPSSAAPPSSDVGAPKAAAFTSAIESLQASPHGYNPVGNPTGGNPAAVRPAIELASEPAIRDTTARVQGPPSEPPPPADEPKPAPPSGAEGALRTAAVARGSLASGGDDPAQLQRLEPATTSSTPILAALAVALVVAGAAFVMLWSSGADENAGTEAKIAEPVAVSDENDAEQQDTAEAAEADAADVLAEPAKERRELRGKGAGFAVTVAHSPVRPAVGEPVVLEVALAKGESAVPLQSVAATAAWYKKHGKGVPVDGGIDEGVGRVELSFPRAGKFHIALQLRTEGSGHNAIALRASCDICVGDEDRLCPNMKQGCRLVRQSRAPKSHHH